MNTQLFTIDINAPKAKVWDTMLADSTYRAWTAAFHEGSYYAGSWEKGSTIRFLAEDDGKLSGMVSNIVENIPHQYISIEHLGEVIDGIDDTTSENAQLWAGAHENYTFDEAGGVTTLKIELENQGENEEMTKMFEQMWPTALNKLKEICEQ